jgi:hypothetical protein
MKQLFYYIQVYFITYKYITASCINKTNWPNKPSQMVKTCSFSFITRINIKNINNLLCTRPFFYARVNQTFCILHHSLHSTSYFILLLKFSIIQGQMCIIWEQITELYQWYKLLHSTLIMNGMNFVFPINFPIL